MPHGLAPQVAANPRLWPWVLPGPLPAATTPLSSITAVVQTDFFPPRVLVTVSGLTTYNADHVTIYRQVFGVRTVLRGADNVVTGGNDAIVRTDAEQPFGVPVTYVAIIKAGALTYEIVSTPITATIAKVVLTDAISGNSAQVVIVAWPDKTSSKQFTSYLVGGRVVVVSGPRSATPSSVVDLMTETDSARENLAKLLREATAGVVQLRCEDPIKYADVDCYLAVLEDKRERWSQDGSDQRRRWSLTVQETEPWAAALEAGGFTLQDLANAYPIKLQQIADAFTTLLDIAVADLIP